MRLAIAAIAAAVLAAFAAGCGGAGHATPGATTDPGGCPLSTAQLHDIARAKQEIVRMHRLELPLKTVHATGPPALENAVNRFLLDVGPLPPDTKGNLMDLGKAASALCEDCFNAIEADEPAVQTRAGRPPCAAR